MNHKQTKNFKEIFLIFYFCFTSFLTVKTFQFVGIQHFEIKGSELFSKETLINNSSLTFPKRLIFINTKLIENELKDNLSLKNVTVRRNLIPFGLKILVKTRRPVAYGEKILKGEKISGFIDENGFFIEDQYSDEKNLSIVSTRVFGWKKKFRKALSEIFSYQKNSQLELISISYSQNGFLTLEEKKLKKILLGFDPNLIKTQLKTISNIKNQLKGNIILNKIEKIDLTNPSEPKIKVFKP